MKFYIFLLFILITNILFDSKMTTEKNRPILPKKLRIGYASWSECDEKIFEAVENGINVLIWFSIDMSSDETNKKPKFTRGPNYDDVAKMVEKIKKNNYDIINLISIGGWNSAHVNTNFTAEEYFNEWIEFNKNISKGEFFGFDGIDWDIEGHDNFSSSTNHFTFDELNLMGEFSKLLKKNNYIVSMAPAESYLDVYTNEFSLSLLHNHDEWKNEFPDFNYHGRNVYAYLLAKFSVDTFDFISIQLYEGLTHALYKYEKEKIKFGEIIENLIEKYIQGYEVDFSSEKDCDLGKKIIKIDENKIVIGLANGWAKDKFLFVDEKEIIEGYKYLREKGKDIRGMMYWTIAEEGKIPEYDKAEKKPFYMAKILKEIF